MTKQDELQALAQEIVANNICPELATSARHLVFGEGNPDSEIIFVGEAPGKNEDLQGRPFVGAAGKFLNEMLDKIGLKREDVYVTNIVKYRPPKNRDPLPKEKNAFLPYLRRQIEIIKPKLIITLGRHSMECFLPGLTISQAHGQCHAVDGKTIMPIFHPMAAMTNGRLLKATIKDFQSIPTILETI